MRQEKISKLFHGYLLLINYQTSVLIGLIGLKLDERHSTSMFYKSFKYLQISKFKVHYGVESE